MTDDTLAKMMLDYSDMPLRDVVFQTLRKGILRGDLQPGERLMEIQLANRLGVSRTPVREAIRMLELEGLVTNPPHKGAQVAKITEKDLQDVLEVREGLEEMAVKLACERITEQELKELYEASRRFEKMALAKKGSITELAEADEDFHAIIYCASGNRQLVQLINNLREQMFRYRVEYLKDEENLVTLIKEHDGLWESLKRRDINGARRNMRMHIGRQMDAIREMISE